MRVALRFAAWVAAALASTAAAETPPRIRHVVVERQDVFAPDERLQVPGLPDLTFVFDVANWIHIQTKEQVIRREILLEEGEIADPERLAESERNLRDLPFVRRVRLFTRPTETPGWVDLVVQTQDTWTTEPRASFSSGGGSSKAEVGIVEKNLLGYGKTVAVRYRDDVDRSSRQLLYDDPLVLGTRFRLRGELVEASDGRTRTGLFEYPFFAFETPWAGGVGGGDIEEHNHVFGRGGDRLSTFRRNRTFADVGIARRLPWSTGDVVYRLGAFHRYVDDDFTPLRRTDPDFFPEDRLRSSPGISLERTEIRFVKERHLTFFDRPEDLNLGNSLAVAGSYSARMFGARDDEPIVSAFDRQGFDFGNGHKAFLYGGVSGRYDGGELENAVAEIEAVSFNRTRLFFENTLVTRVKLDLGRNLDEDVQLFLGNDNGLRGYDTREFVGSKRFIANLEDRIFFVNDLFHLVSLGAVLFFDAGYVWPAGDDVNLRQVASAVGIGLRIGLPRAAGEKIFRFDLAVPLSTTGGEQFRPGFSFGSGQAFAPFSGPFDLQSSSNTN